MGTMHATGTGMGGAAGGGAGGAMHAAAIAIPPWLGIVGAVVFGVITLEHLCHLARTGGQRRAWHASHVLIAVGMAFMFAPRAVDPLAVSPGLWQLLFALAGVIAAVWALSGSARVPTLMWLLTAGDMGAMVCMWSPQVTAPLRWGLLIYLPGQALLWAVDAYRRLDGGPALIAWPAFTSVSAGAGGGGGATAMASGGRGGGAAVATAPAEALIGDLDLTVSMFAMAAGMAYMFIAMQLL